MSKQLVKFVLNYVCYLHVLNNLDLDIDSFKKIIKTNLYLTYRTLGGYSVYIYLTLSLRVFEVSINVAEVVILIGRVMFGVKR